MLPATMHRPIIFNIFLCAYINLAASATTIPKIMPTETPRPEPNKICGVEKMELKEIANRQRLKLIKTGERAASKVTARANLRTPLPKVSREKTIIMPKKTAKRRKVAVIDELPKRPPPRDSA